MLSIRELRDRAIIRPIKRAVEDQLLDLPGVTAVDIGQRRIADQYTGDQVIVVSVQRKRSYGELPAGACVPAGVLGIPVDVIEEDTALHHLHCCAQEPLLLRERHRDLPAVIRGGQGIAPCRSVFLASPATGAPGQYHRIGTLGALVAGHDPPAAPMGLTTFDVACMDDAWSVGDRMIDPDVGRVYADLARAALSGRVDAAAVTISGDLEASCAISGLGPVTGQCTAYPGDHVRKSGYGTALSSGVVVSTDTTLRVDHGDALGVRVLREQIRVAASPPGARFAGDGDAGSAVVNVDGRVAGLLVAGSPDGAAGFACPIADVLAELDVELCAETRELSV